MNYIQLNDLNYKTYILLDNNECRLMSLSQRYKAAHKCTGWHTNDTGRRTKGIEGNIEGSRMMSIYSCDWQKI